MAQEILVRLVVDDTQLEQTEQEIKKLGGSIEKVEKTTKKAGSNISDSFDKADDAANNLQGGVEGAAKQVQVLGKAAKTSGAAMRSALIATGIGALIVAVGFLVDNWEAIADAIDDSNKKLREQIELSKKAQETSKLRLDLINSEIKLNEKLGIGNEKLQEQRIEIVKTLREQNAEELKLLETQALKLKTSALELNTREKITRAILNAAGTGAGDQFILDKQTEALAQYKEIQDLILQSKKEQVDLDVKIFDLQNPERATTKQSPVEEQTAQQQFFGGEIRNISESETEALKSGIVEIDTFARQINEIEQTVTDNLDAQTKERIRIRQLETEAAEEQNQVRLQSADRLGAALFALGQESKEAAVAGIIVDQIAGAAQAIQSNVVANAKAVAAFPLTAGQPWVTINTASTIAGIAAGALAAKRAISELGGGGSPGSVGSVPQGQQAQAPSFNVVGTSGVNQLAQTLGNDETPIRAYVVGGDVTSQQEFDRNVIETSSI